MNNKEHFHRSDDPEAGGAISNGDHEEFLTKDEAIEAGLIEEQDRSASLERNLGKTATETSNRSRRPSYGENMQKWESRRDKDED